MKMDAMGNDRRLWREITTGALGNALGGFVVLAVGALAALAYRYLSPILPSIIGLGLVATFVIAAALAGFAWGDKRRKKLDAASQPALFDVTVSRHKDVLKAPNQAVIVIVGQRGRLIRAYWTDDETLALKIPISILNWWTIEFKLDRLIGEVNFNASWELAPLPAYMKKESIPPQTERGFLFDYTWRVTPAQNEVLRIGANSSVVTVLQVTPHAYLTFRGEEFQADGGSQVEVLIPGNPRFIGMADPPPLPPALSLARGPQRTRRTP